MNPANNFIFNTSYLTECNRIFRTIVEYTLDGLAVEFKSFGMNIYTLENNADGTVDLTPRWVYNHFDKDIQETEGDVIAGAELIIPENGYKNTHPVFFKNGVCYLPYKI